METEYGMWPVPPYDLAQKHIDANLPDYLHPFSGGFSEYGRIYRDYNDALEVSTPEVYTLDGLLAVHFAGEDLACGIVKKLLGGKSHLQKISLDGKWHSRGEHENFMVGANFTDDYLAKLVPFLVARAVLTGPGTVYEKGGKFQYAIDARTLMSDPMCPIKSGSTQSDCGQKPFMKSMNASGDVDPSGKTRRVQVVSGSMNMYAFPVAARMFCTSAVLRLIERDEYPDELLLQDIPNALATITKDTWMTEKIEAIGGQQYTTAEFLMKLFDRTMDIDLPEDEKAVIELSRQKLTAIVEGDLDACRGYIEWMDKLVLLEEHAARNGYVAMNSQSAQINIRWHERRTDGKRSITERLRDAGRVALYPADQAKEDAKRMPPDKTRALDRTVAIAETAAAGSRFKNLHWNRWCPAEQLTATVQDNAWAGYNQSAAE